MTDSTDEIDYGYDEEDERSEEDKELVKKYDGLKDCYVQMRLWGEEYSLTLQDIIKLARILQEDEI